MIRPVSRFLTHLNAGLHEIEFEGERLAHEDVRIVRVLEGGLQLLQLPAREVSSSPSPFGPSLFPIIPSFVGCNRIYLFIYGWFEGGRGILQ